jgi:hypothetical protein
MMPEALRTRCERVKYKLKMLSNKDSFLIPKNGQTPSGLPIIFLETAIRIPEAKVLFRIKEEHRDLTLEKPTLYSFYYHLAPEDDHTIDRPHFRYECHPDVGKPSGDPQEYSSPYAYIPHFHQSALGSDSFEDLHYPFHRSERRKIFFALVDWLHQDYLLRFVKVRRFRESPWTVPSGPPRDVVGD